MCIYNKILRPILFLMDPEKVHERALKLGVFLGRHKITKLLTRILYRYRNPVLETTINGIKFRNPVGLAAGFDKNAVLTDIIPEVGFGFQEIGSVTAKKCEGNPKPRLFRLPKDKAIAVNYGLCNDGADAIYQRLRNKNFKIPLFVSIAKTNDSRIKGKDSAEDYAYSYGKFRKTTDFIVLNISCPNTGDGRSFEDPILLEQLLKKIIPLKKMTFLKISPDINKKSLDKIIDLSEKYGVHGFVIANLTHNASRLKTPKEDLRKVKGSFSGPANKALANNLIKYVYKKTSGKACIIGVGGVSSAEDAYEMIKNGATLVQLITGMIYEGPSIIKNINKGLVNLMEREGYKSIKEVVGINAGKKA